MANFDDEDLEIEAIARCAKALSPLDKESKTRVIRYLLDKYGFIEALSNNHYSSSSSTPQPSMNEKQLLSHRNGENSREFPTDNTTEDITNEATPSLYELMTKNHTKNEKEILLMVLYYKTNYGKNSVDRSSIMEAYKEQEIYTETRNKNLSYNLDTLIKQSYISAITKTKYGITPDGLKQIQLIIQGKSESKASKPRSIKRKASNNNDK